MSNTTTNLDPTPAPDTTSTPPPTPAPAPAPAAAATAKTETDTETNPSPIDALLTHYLALLDEYTTLRGTLHTLQSRMFHDLARANFAAERGVRRYGRDYYDGRMQAGRRVHVSSSSDGAAAAAAARMTVVGGGDEEGEGEGGVRGSRGEGEGEGVVFRVAVYPPSERAGGGKEAEDGPGTGDGAGNGEEKLAEREGSDAAPDDGEGGKETVKPVDPLRWFGILTPLPLRQAQGHAIKAVEEIIPRLATLSTAMAAVELEVRRARKKRAKAGKAEEKRLVALEEKMAEVDVNA